MGKMSAGDCSRHNHAVFTADDTLIAAASSRGTVHMNELALAETQRTGFATFYSRTRGKLWTKGETSGNRLAVKEILVDCDDDTVLVKVKRLGDGNVCHTGQRTCFFRAYREDVRDSEVAP